MGITTTKAALVICILMVASSAVGRLAAAESGGAGSKKASNLLGAPGFLPTPDNAVGWRGDGTGRYPGAMPPQEWYIHLKNCPGLASSASKPKGEPRLADVPDIALGEWIALGSWLTDDLRKAMDTAYLPDEATVEPSEGDKVGDMQWKRLPMQNGAVNLTEVFGETQREAGQNPQQDDPKQKKVIYAATYVYAASAGEAELYLTHSNGYRLFFNGEPVIKKESVGPAAVFGGEPARQRLTVKPGWNRLLLKSCGSQSAISDHQWAFSAWLQRLPAKGARLDYESRNIAYQTALPGSSVSDPIVVGDRLFVTGNHWLAAVRKQDGQLLWYRTIIPHDGHVEDTKGEPAVIDQYKTACRKVHELDEQYARQFKDGNVPTALADQYKQLETEMKGLLDKLDHKRADMIYKVGFLQSEPGWAMTPCSDGKNVYAWDQMAVAACYDLDGKAQWTTTVAHGGGQEHGYSASPVFADGRFVCCQKNLMAFDARTGAVAWSSADYHSSWGSLVRAKAGAETVVVGPDNFCYSASDGKPFHGDKGSKPKGDTTSTPIAIDGAQAGGMSSGNGFDLVGLGASVKHTAIPWPSYGLNGGLRADGPIASPVYHDGLAYVITMGGTLVIFDLQARKLAGFEHLNTRTCYSGSSVGGRAGITASPVFAGGLLYFFDDSGNTLVREPGAKGKVLARHTMLIGPPDQNGRLISTNSSPVFDESRIYWRAGNRLYCIGEK